MSSASWTRCRAVGACAASALWRGRRFGRCSCMAGVDYSGCAGHVLGGGRAGHGWRGICSPGGAGSHSAVVGACCARSGLTGAYGGASSVGSLHASSCELPGVVRSKARLIFCMILEQTGDLSLALAAGRAEEARSAAAAESCRRSGAMGCGAGRRFRKRGVPARRLKASSCANGEIAPSRSAQRACEEASSLRQGLQVTSTFHTSRASYSTPRRAHSIQGADIAAQPDF